MTTCASFEGEWFFTTGKLEFFALFPTGYELDTNDNGLSHAISKKIFCRDGRRKKSQKRVLNTHTRRRRDGRGGGGDYEKAGTTMMIRRRRTDGDCRAAVLATAAAVTEAATGASGGRIIIIVITTRAAVNTVIQHTSHRLPATVRKITKIAKPGQIAHDVQIRSTRPKVIFPGAVAGLFRSNPYRLLLEGETSHRR